MALIDEHDKKPAREQILFCQEVKNFADCLLMKMQLGMGRMSSYKEMFGFFHGHIDVFKKSFVSDDDGGEAKIPRIEWLAELNFKFAEITAMFSHIAQFPPQEHPGRYYYFAAEQYLELKTSEKTPQPYYLEKFIVSLKKAIKFFEAYQQSRHLRLCKFQLAKHLNTIGPEITDPFQFGWPSLRCQYLELAIKQQTNQSVLLEQVWELANTWPDKFSHLLVDQFHPKERQEAV